MAVLKIINELMILKHLFLSLSNKNRIVQKVVARLQSAFEQIELEIS